MTWLTVPDLVQRIEISPGRIHRLIEDRQLVGVRIDGALRVPESFLLDDQPLPELRGTLILLADAGLTDEEAVIWLLTPEESLGVAPIDALRSGRKAPVRRIAQALG